MRFDVKRWAGAALLLALVLGLGGCVYPGPGYYDGSYYAGPAYYPYYPYAYGPPAYGSVWIGGGWGHRHWR